MNKFYFFCSQSAAHCVKTFKNCLTECFFLVLGNLNKANCIVLLKNKCAEGTKLTQFSRYEQLHVNP